MSIESNDESAPQAMPSSSTDFLRADNTNNVIPAGMVGAIPDTTSFTNTAGHHPLKQQQKYDFVQASLPSNVAAAQQLFLASLGTDAMQQHHVSPYQMNHQLSAYLDPKASLYGSEYSSRESSRPSTTVPTPSLDDGENHERRNHLFYGQQQQQHHMFPATSEYSSATPFTKHSPLLSTQSMPVSTASSSTTSLAATTPLLSSRSESSSPATLLSSLPQTLSTTTTSLSSLSSQSVPVSRRNSHDVGLWAAMNALNLESRNEADPSSSSSSVDSGDCPLAPPQFSDKFLYEDEQEQETAEREAKMMQFDNAQLFEFLKHSAAGADYNSQASLSPSLSGMSAALDLATLPQTSSSSSLRTSKSVPDWSQVSGDILAAYRDLQSQPELLKKIQQLQQQAQQQQQQIQTQAQQQSQQQASEQAQAAVAVAAAGNLCRYYLQGYCSRGDRCNYAHIPTLAPTSPSLGTLTVGSSSSTTPSLPASSPNPASAAAAAAAAVNNARTAAAVSAYLSNPFNAAATAAAAANQAALNYAAAATSAGINPAVYSSMYNNPAMAYAAAASMGLNPMKLNAAGLAAAAAAAGFKQRGGKIPVTEEVNRFLGVPLEELAGQLYAISKDQHGCRYLQKKLEDQNEVHVDMIFNEICPHFVELMTDPFGNYLCQKLLEYCNEEQRTIIVDSVAPELVNIALNMHGTRAVQKMIDFLSNSVQIRTIVIALSLNVVPLIKDLNGNHVIQKCLNRLTPEQNQFIYNAVTKHLMEVATHRHGCCVLQRCIDHSSDSQKIQLVTEITYHALALVQDPFGNYVVQYVLDLSDPRFTDTLIRRFVGNVCILSVQKFSSNVVEKCIRVGDAETRRMLLEELLNRERLDKLLRDSFGNYVIQTALDFADPVQRAKLVDCIRPLLPAIRNTPYGKRISSKLHREQMSQYSGMLAAAGFNPFVGAHPNSLAVAAAAAALAANATTASSPALSNGGLPSGTSTAGSSPLLHGHGLPHQQHQQQQHQQQQLHPQFLPPHQQHHLLPPNASMIPQFATLPPHPHYAHYQHLPQHQPHLHPHQHPHHGLAGPHPGQPLPPSLNPNGQQQYVNMGGQGMSNPPFSGMYM